MSCREGEVRKKKGQVGGRELRSLREEIGKIDRREANVASP